MIDRVTFLAFALTTTACFSADNISKEWSQWGGRGARNNTPTGVGIPSEWQVGDFDFRTGAWDPSTAANIKWAARLGSQSYGNVVVADGKAFVGTNNAGGRLERYPSSVDLGCLIAFDVETGEFLWQHSSEKLKSGNAHDWPLQGICCAPLVEGKRLWFVTSRGEVRCLDTEGFRDDENNGPFEDEAVVAPQEADVIWVFDMMDQLGSSQHNMCSCSVTAIGDTLLCATGNGVDEETHTNVPAPDAPSFFALDKNTGELLWTDNSPGRNILHGQWSSPAVGEITMPDGSTQAQAIFGGGDGWVYSFDPAGDGSGGAKLLWKFDANPKESRWVIGGRGDRNNIVATPVIEGNLVYAVVGQDPDNGDGVGHLWCIDPTGEGDVSPELAFNTKDRNKPIPPKRVQAVVADEGDFASVNQFSKVVWHYSTQDLNGDGEIDEYLETMHRSLGTVAIKDGILYIADTSGIFHCLDAKTGKVHWTYDMFAAAWGSPLIVDGKVYIGDEDGDIAIFRHSADPAVAMEQGGGDPTPALGEVNMGNSVYSTPIVADNVLYISNRTHLFAIENEE